MRRKIQNNLAEFRLVDVLPVRELGLSLCACPQRG